MPFTLTVILTKSERFSGETFTIETFTADDEKAALVKLALAHWGLEEDEADEMPEEILKEHLALNIEEVAVVAAFVGTPERYFGISLAGDEK